MSIRGTRRSAHLALAWVSSFSALLFALASCGDSPTPPPPPHSPEPIISEPVGFQGAGAATAARASTSTAPAAGYGALSFAYISLPPGTAPGAVSVIIRDDSRGTTITAPLRMGGLDPTPVAAAPGDELRLDLNMNSGAVTTSLITVPPRRPPKVVRTDPPKQKTGVALNARIIVVFSEPIDAASLTTSSVQLLQGTTAVPGTLALQAGSAVSAEFVPASLLEPFTEYRLVVTQNVRDLEGSPLEEAVTIEFTTGDAQQVRVASVSIPDLYTVLTNDTAHLQVILNDAAGNVLKDRQVTWSSADPAIAVAWPTDSGGVVAGLGPGFVTVTVTSEGVKALALLDVAPPEPSPYPAVSLGALGGRSSWARGINDQGEIVGSWAATSRGPLRGFFRTAAGVMVDIGDVQPQDISNNRHVVGSRRDPATGTTHAVRLILDAGGSVLRAEELGVGFTRSVNNLGQVVGAVYKGPGVGRAAVWLTPDAPPQELGGIADGNTDAYGINDRGVIAGSGYDSRTMSQYAMRWTPTTGLDGKMTWGMGLLLPDRKNNGALGAPNDRGDIVGAGLQCEPAPGCGASSYLWRGNDLTILPDLARGPSAAYAINDAGYVAGWSHNERRRNRAVVWTPTGDVVLLGMPRGASSSEAYAINAAGQIVGTGQFSDGRSRAVVWNLFK